MTEPLVSIIIPTFDAAAYIKTCLESVHRQTYRNLETIVVDNLSIDGTPSIAASYGCKVISRRSTWPEAIACGVENSHGSYYFVMESSLEIFPLFIEACVKKAESNREIVGLIGPEYSQGAGFWARCMKLERALNVGYEVVEAPRFIRRSAFNRIGGYDTSIDFGADWDFFTRLRRIGQVCRVDVGWIHHEGTPTPYTMMRKKYRYGRTARRYLGKSLSMSDSVSFFQFLPIRPNFVRKAPVLRSAGVRVVLGYILLKTVEMMAVLAAMTTSTIDEARGKEIRYGRALTSSRARAPDPNKPIELS